MELAGARVAPTFGQWRHTTSTQEGSSGRGLDVPGPIAAWSTRAVTMACWRERFSPSLDPRSAVPLLTNPPRASVRVDGSESAPKPSRLIELHRRTARASAIATTTTQACSS